jgi:hypothetical protein
MSGLRETSEGEYVSYSGEVVAVGKRHVCIETPRVADYRGERGSGLAHAWVPKPRGRDVAVGDVVAGDCTLTRYGPRDKPSFQKGGQSWVSEYGYN